MLEFILGFSIGIYIGTFYECKPTLDTVILYINKYIQPKKN